MVARRGSQVFRNVGDTITLRFPMPPSPNSRRTTNPMAAHRQAEAYKRKVWAAALQQVTPLQTPPRRVLISTRFKFYGKRMDRDNRWGALKWVVDALKQRQEGKAKYRGGVAAEGGYILDDDDRFLEYTEPEVEPGRHQPQELEITLEVLAP